MNDQDEIIRTEFESLIKDIRAVYESSGKKVSGEFSRSLEFTQNGSTAVLKGVPYLAGRRAGRMPPVQNILNWINGKGISAAGSTPTALAWAIAKKIGSSGTDPNNHLKIYDQIITPERIDEIIKKVSVFNVNFFTTELIVELNKLSKNI